jgi:hypothetical protein
MASAATIMPITQPRTVRNLVHSERSTRAKPALLAGAPARRGVTVPAVIA